MKNNIKNIIYFLLYFIWFLWFYSQYFFGEITAEQILFHFQYGFDTLDFDLKPITTIFFQSLITTSFIVLAIYISKYIFSLACKKFPSLKFLKSKIWSLFSVFIIFVLYYAMYSSIKLEYLLCSAKEDFIKEHYINPKNITINKVNKKNLVLIYLESIEKTYSKEYIMGKNLLQELDDLPGVEFNNYTQTPNTGWTIASIVGTQCAIPLKFVLMGQDISKTIKVKNFLPAATCMGDILAAAGYHNEYIQGASLAYSGKDQFFKSHSYHLLKGKEEWLTTQKYTEKDMNAWGMYDDLLMQEARISLDKLVATKQPFNLTILTLDTHFPKGYLSKSCKDAGGESLHDIIKCSTKQVADFVKYIIDKGYLEHTNIVILGDHLSVPSEHNNLIARDPNRSIYNKWISKDSFIKNKDQITHFDITPTILDFLGLQVKGGRYGLGYSSFGKKNDHPKNMISNYFTNFNYRSDFYNSLWKI